jgi:hypothetical protein
MIRSKCDGHESQSGAFNFRRARQQVRDAAFPALKLDLDRAKRVGTEK